MILLLGISKGLSILAVICLIGLLIAYKLFSILAAKPDQQLEKIDMLSRRINQLEREMTQINQKLDLLNADSNNLASDPSQENHD